LFGKVVLADAMVNIMPVIYFQATCQDFRCNGRSPPKKRQKSRSSHSCDADCVIVLTLAVRERAREHHSMSIQQVSRQSSEHLAFLSVEKPSCQRLLFPERPTRKEIEDFFSYAELMVRFVHAMRKKDVL
jgi:hypothetical protein